MAGPQRTARNLCAACLAPFLGLAFAGCPEAEDSFRAAEARPASRASKTTIGARAGKISQYPCMRATTKCPTNR